MKKSLEESILHTLDGGRNPEVMPYLDYLLQDFWEMGASPRQMLELLKANLPHGARDLRIADLGCGKGAVSITLASELGARVFGVDGMPSFIRVARQKAVEHGVAERCRFEAGDVRDWAGQMSGFDVAILGATGPLWGTYDATWQSIRRIIRPGGYILVDDAYVREGSRCSNPVYLDQNEFFRILRRARLEVIDQIVSTEEQQHATDAAFFHQIQIRVMELERAHPEMRPIFQAYLDNQRRENAVLESEVSCVTLLLQHRPDVMAAP